MMPLIRLGGGNALGFSAMNRFVLAVFAMCALAAPPPSLAADELPAPGNMARCPAGQHFAVTLERVASQLGHYLDCFVSPDKTSLMGMGTRMVSVPVEYAYAVEAPRSRLRDR